MTIKACLFDVFGTCVDWRGSVETMLTEQFALKGIEPQTTQIPRFARDWRAGYSEYNRKVSADEIDENDIVTIDIVHRRVLAELVQAQDLQDVWTSDELDQMNLIWHKLTPWPDTAKGIDALRERCIVGTLSNGNVRLLVDMAKHSDLHWDVILSSAMYRSAKGNPKVYLGGCQSLDLKPEEVVMVACHFNDLEAASSCGLRTAFIRRQGEADERDPAAEPYIDFIIDEIGDLTTHI